MTEVAATDNGQSTPGPAGTQSLASQNKGGLLLGLAGAALGCLTGNPLLILAGLASGFIAGSVGIDRRDGVVDSLVSSRQTLGEIESQPGEVVTLDSPSRAEPTNRPQVALNNSPALQNVSFDSAFSDQNGALVAAPSGAKRTARRHR